MPTTPATLLGIPHCTACPLDSLQIMTQKNMKRKTWSPLVLFGLWLGASAVHAAPGLVLAWGTNDYGQTTTPLAARSNVTVVAAGKSHTVALKADGSVVAWGAGQIDTG